MRQKGQVQGSRHTMLKVECICTYHGKTCTMESLITGSSRSIVLFCCTNHGQGLVGRQVLFLPLSDVKGCGRGYAREKSPFGLRWTVIVTIPAIYLSVQLQEGFLMISRGVKGEGTRYSVSNPLHWSSLFIITSLTHHISLLLRFSFSSAAIKQIHHVVLCKRRDRERKWN